MQDCTKLNELLKVKEIQIIDHKKRIADSDVKRQQQQVRALNAMSLYLTGIDSRCRVAGFPSRL